jgi:cytochrome P450
MQYRPQNWDPRSECNWASAMNTYNEVQTRENLNTSYGIASIRAPVRGSYLPFSDGARGCLGKRFAEVEFVAIMTMIFRHYRVQLDDEGKMGWEDLRRETQKILDESFTSPTLSIQTHVPLRFIRRRG